MIFKPSRLFFVAALVAALTGPVAGAQDRDVNSAAERMAACLEIADAAERLACFEAGAATLTQALEEEEPAEADVVAEPTVQPEVAATPAAPEASATEQPAPVQPAPAPVVEAPAPAAPAPEAEPLPEWARVTAPPKAKEGTPDELKVSVVRILRNTAGRHFFVLSDGQEWEQTMKGTVRPPASLPAAATIESSLFGSPRLTFDDGPSGAYKVRRTK